MQEQAMAGASFGERLVAFIIDWVIMAVVGFILGLILQNQLLSSLIGIVVGLAYYIGFWTTQGATLGKMAMSLKVIDKNTGGLIDPGKGFLRYIGYIISAIPIFLGYFWMLWDPQKETWHDKISGTRVVKAK
jgi:uncharacterized RDD family membrane protein YckC